jgi:hypothetical protein
MNGEDASRAGPRARRPRWREPPLRLWRLADPAALGLDEYLALRLIRIRAYACSDPSAADLLADPAVLVAAALAFIRERRLGSAEADLTMSCLVEAALTGDATAPVVLSYAHAALERATSRTASRHRLLAAQWRDWSPQMAPFAWRIPRPRRR